MVEWSKTVDSGSTPSGRGFKSHSRHFSLHFLSFRLRVGLKRVA